MALEIRQYKTFILILYNVFYLKAYDLTQKQC